MEGDGAVGPEGHAEPDDERLAGAGSAVAFIPCQFPHGVVGEPYAGGILGFGQSVLPGEVAIGESFGKKSFSGLDVLRAALGLIVLLVPGQFEPAQAVDDGLESFVGAALAIGVVDAEDHLPGVLTSEEPVEDVSASPANVQEPRWGRRKANACHQESEEKRRGSGRKRML